MPFELRTPVVFLVFNRPDLTRKSFAAIAAMRPKRLLIVADGPRPDRPGEAEKCRATREIVSRIDWECEVERAYSESNLGCRHRISSGVSWAFGRVDEAIIVEDDCLPNASFFRFCQEMLDRYRDDERIMMVSGSKFRRDPPRGEYSYYFSRWGHIWGWATWRRAWRYYDVKMPGWPEFRAQNRLRDIVESQSSVRRWVRMFDEIYEGRVDTWDFQWAFAMISQSGLSVQPRDNLVTNVGFGPEATHTRKKTVYAGLPQRELGFPLKHPPFVLADTVSDNQVRKREFSVLHKAWDRLLLVSGLHGRRAGDSSN